MKAMKSLGVILLAAVLLVCGVSASAEAPEAGDFSFAGGVRFGESMDEALNRLYEQDIDCLDFREAYGDGDPENDPSGEIALIHSYGITCIDRIRFAYVEAEGLPAYGYYYFGSEDSMGYVRYVLEDIDEPGQRDLLSDYGLIEEKLAGAYGEAEWSDRTGMQSGIMPSLMPQDFMDEGITVHREIERYSERLADTGGNAVLIQHVLYTNEQDDNPGYLVRYHELCYTYVPNQD